MASYSSEPGGPDHHPVRHRVREHLGRRAKPDEPDPVDVRIGGIYALERIAADSDVDRLVVFEVLSAFIREHSPANRKTVAQTSDVDRLVVFKVLSVFIREHSPANRKTVAQTVPDGAEHSRPSADIHAAMTVLGRRQVKLTDLRLDLAQTNLSETRLFEAGLGGASLIAANLHAASLSQANLMFTSLHGADVSTAFLSGAKLNGADLSEADLSEANLVGADSTHANLSGANLDGADLSWANLALAFLRSDHAEGEPEQGEAGRNGFRGVDLTGANLDGVKLDAVIYDEKTTWPEGLESPPARGSQTSTSGDEQPESCLP